MSADGFHDRVKALVETEPAESPVGVDGGCVSGQGAVVGGLKLTALVVDDQRVREVLVEVTNRREGGAG